MNANPLLLQINDKRRQQFDCDGYLVVPGLLDPAELSDLNEELHQRYLEGLKDPAIADDEQRRNQAHGLGASSERSKTLAGDPRILDLVEPLVAPGVALFSAKLISKGPNEPLNVCHWRQDDAYWQAISHTDDRLSVWVPLQDTDQTNGCLRVVPGSHHQGLIAHEPRSSRDHGACRLSFLPGEADVPGAVDCPVSVGDVVLFSAKVFHSSLGNHTSAHRRAFILTYQDALTPAGKFGEFVVLRSPS